MSRGKLTSDRSFAVVDNLPDINIYTQTMFGGRDKFS